ncbi:glycosyl transferase, partial [bacterium]
MSFLDLLRGPSPAFPQGAEQPIRSELFSVDRLEQHAESLAAAQAVTTKALAARSLARRLKDNGRMLLAAYRTIAESIREERAITPAAEWLVDNFHVVEEQIREIHADLPRGFYRQLPKLAQGHLAGYPRVFGIAWAFVAHTDSRFDTEALCRFVSAYQRVQPLTIGELWAVAITLRIVLVENLRRSAEQIVRRRIARQEADALADQLLAPGNQNRFILESTLDRYDRKSLTTAFAVQLVQRLRDQDPAVVPALHWLERRLALQGTNPDEIVRSEHQQQGAMSVTVRNVITSMRLMSAVDWPKLFEKVSLVDEELRAGSDFAAMDFPTRDRYRHAIEELARGSGRTELEVTRRAIGIAQLAAEQPLDKPTDPRTHDPGYYLISSGRSKFEEELGFRPALKRWLARAYRSAGLFGYLAAIMLLSALFLGLGLLAMIGAGVSGPVLYFLALLGLVPATDAAVAIMNFDVTNQFNPAALPGL